MKSAIFLLVMRSKFDNLPPTSLSAQSHSPSLQVHTSATHMRTVRCPLHISSQALAQPSAKRAQSWRLRYPQEHLVAAAPQSCCSSARRRRVRRRLKRRNRSPACHRKALRGDSELGEVIRVLISDTTMHTTRARGRAVFFLRVGLTTMSTEQLYFLFQSRTVLQ